MKAEIANCILALVYCNLVFAAQYKYELVKTNSFTTNTSYNMRTYPFKLQNQLFYKSNVTLNENDVWLFNLAEEVNVVNVTLAVKDSNYNFDLILSSGIGAHCLSSYKKDICFETKYQSNKYYEINVGFNSTITKYIKLSAEVNQMLLYFIVYTEELKKPSYFNPPASSMYSIYEASFFSNNLNVNFNTVPQILNLTTTNIQPINSFNTEFDGFQVAWFTIKLSKVQLVHQFIVMSSNENDFNFIKGISLSFRINETRNFIIYKENDEMRVFASNYISSKWFCYTLTNPFMASEIRINIDSGDSLMNFKMDFRFIESIEYQYKKPTIESLIFSKNDSLIMNFNASNLITGLMFDTIDQLLEFCIYYEVNGEYLPYKDNKLFNDIIVFSISSEIYLYPFRTSSLKLSCLKWNTVSESNVTIAVKGTSYLTADYSWSIENMNAINNFVQYTSVVGTEILFGDSVKMQKSNSLNRLMSNHFGPSCYTQPDLCDTGFTVQLNVKVPFSSHDVELNFRPTNAFYIDSNNNIFEPELIHFGQSYTTFFSFNNVNLPSNAAVSRFQFFIGSYQGSGPNPEDFLAQAYLLVSQHETFEYYFTTQLFTNTALYLSNEDNITFLFNGSNAKSYNSLDLLNLYNIVSNKYFGLVKHIGIVIIPNNQVDGNNFDFNRNGFKLVISYRTKVIGNADLSSHVTTVNSIVYRLDDSYYITKIQFQNKESIKETYALFSYDFSGYHFFAEFEKVSGDNSIIVVNSFIKTQMLKFDASYLINPVDVKFWGRKDQNQLNPIYTATAFYTWIFLYVVNFDGEGGLLIGQWNGYPSTSLFTYEVNLPLDVIVTNLNFKINNQYYCENVGSGFNVRVYLLMSQVKTFNNMFIDLKNMLYKYSKWYLSNEQYVIYNLSPSDNSIDLLSLYNSVLNKYSGTITYIGFVVMPDNVLSQNMFYCKFRKSNIQLEMLWTGKDQLQLFNLNSAMTFNTAINMIPFGTSLEDSIVFGQSLDRPITATFMYKANLPLEITSLNFLISSTYNYYDNGNEFKMRAYLLVSKDESFNNIFIDLNNMLYNYSKLYLSDKHFVNFIMNPGYNSIDLFNLFNNALNNYSDPVNYIGIIVMPENGEKYNTYCNAKKDQVKLVITYKGIETSITYVPTLKSRIFTFDDKYYITGIEMKNNDIVKETFVLSALSSDAFIQDQYVYVNDFELEGGEFQYITLNGITMAGVLNVTYLNNAPDVQFYGSKYIGMTSSIISAGLGGYENKAQGNGFQIQLNSDNNIVATVVTKDSMYVANMENPIAVPYTLTIVWYKQNDTLFLYHNDDLISVGNHSSVSSRPCLYNEYLLLYADYYNYSNLNGALSGIRMWSIPLSSNEISHLFNETVSDWNNLDANPPSGFKFGSDCYCKNLVCPCEMLELSSTVEYSSRLSDVFLMNDDDYYDEEINVYVFNNLAAYFDNIMLNFQEIWLQKVFIEGSLVSSKSDSCSSITMQLENNAEIVETKWCDSVNSNELFSSPDLTLLLSHLLKVVNYAKPLTIIVRFNGVVLQPGCVLVITYLLPKPFTFIHASAIQSDSRDLLESISLPVTSSCLSFQFKFGGTGFVSLVVLGYTNQITKELAFFYRREGLNQWVTSFINLQNHDDVLSVNFVALKNGLGIGYIALGTILFLSCNKLGEKEPTDFESDLTYLNDSFFPYPAIYVRGSLELFASFPNSIVTSDDNSIFLQTIYGYIEKVSRKTLSFLEVNLNKDFTFTFWYQVKNSQNQIISFMYGKEIKIYQRTTSTIRASVDNLQKDDNINPSLQWHYIVVQYERKFLKLSFEVDFIVSIVYDGIQFPQNSNLTIVLENSIFCFQMYKEILFHSALKATMLCMNKTVENACTQQTSSCEWCNPLYGEWELYPWEYIFDKNGDCLQDLDDFNKTLYQSFNSIINGSFVADNSDGYEVKLSAEVKPVLGFINNGLSTESNYVVVANQDVSNYLSKSSYMFSAWVKHTCEIENQYQPIISTSLVVLLCGVIDINVLSVKPTLVFHDNCLYPLPGKSGLWYNFAFVYNETISVYIDGKPVLKTKCLDSTLPFKDIAQNNDIRVWSVSSNATLVDEVFIGDVAPETLFWRQLTGNMNLKKTKQMTKPSRFHLTSQETWVYETSFNGSYLYERVIAILEPQITELLRSSIREFLLGEVTSMQLIQNRKVICDLDIYLAVQSKEVFQKIAETLNKFIRIFLALQTITFPENSLIAPVYPDDLLVDPTNSDKLLEYYSTLATYEVLLQSKTFVVISLNLFEDVRYPISTAFIQWNQKDGSDTNQIWSNQTNFIIISPLKVFTEYYICFAFTTIRRKMSLCKTQNKSFWTAEGEPVQSPSLNCLVNQANKTMRCNIGKINAQNWKGVQYSYNLVYRIKLPDDNCDNTESKLNHYIITYYNLTTTNPEKLSVIFDTSDYHFLQLCITAYGTTQGGNGIGVANFIVIRTQSTAPDIAPGGLIASFNNSEIIFEWQSLDNDTDVWNDVKAPGSYHLSYGMLKSSLPIAVDSFNTINVSNNQYILKKATRCHVYIAYVNAYSVALGPASPKICFLSPLTKPDCVNPVIKAYYLVDPRTAIFLPDSFDPTYFRGVKKSWLFDVYVTGSYDPGPIELTYRNIMFNFEFAIEDYAEKSAICDDDKLLRFLNQTTNYELTLMGLHPYTSYKVSIQPCNEYGCGNISNPVFFTTYSDIPSCSPNSLYLQNEPDVAVVVSWNALDDSCANGILESYTLKCSGEQSGSLENITSDLSVMFFNLHNYEIICCQVAAVNINGTGPYSSNECIYTPEAEPDAVPMPRNIDMTSFTGSFTILPPDRYEMNGVVLGIKATIKNISIANSTFETSRLQHRSLPYSEEFDFYFSPIDLYSGSVNILFENLLPSFVYNVELQYFNSIGYGPLSDTYQIVTEEYYSEAPSLISYSSDNVRIITVNWSRVPIEKSNGIISQYIICRSQILDNNIIGKEVCFNHTNPLVLMFNLTDLDRGSTHNISVAACNKAGCGKKIYILASAMGFTDGQWLEWSKWGACSKTCDQGKMIRTRICTPHTDGGYDCFGSNLEFTPCQLARCSGFVLGSEGQTNCTAVCSRNNYICSPFYLKPYNDTSLFLDAVIPITCKISLANKVYRSDLDPSFDNSTGVCHGYINIPDEVPCESESTFNQPKMHRLCNCISPDDYGFTKWAHWSFCSETCGNTSVQVRKRNCLGTCTGNSKETRVCDVPLCPVDGEWGSWGNYSECNTTCGYGYQIRTRDCNNPSTVGSGTPCQGVQKDEKPECNAFPCPVDGGYSNWTEWSICSRPCGEGVSISRRYCNNPVPALRGKDCNGSDIMIMPCYLQNCTSIQVDLTLRTLETWDWRMYDINSKEGQTFAQRFKESIYEYFYNNSINGFNRVEVTRLKAGSVIVYYTLTFDYLYDQMILFIDGINQAGKITNISIERTQYYSSDDVSCPPPYNISVASYDKNTVMLSWLRDACINKTDTWLYVYYKDITSANSTWEWRGLDSNKTLGFLPDLITSHKYKAYMLTALSIGNGLPSTLFYFETSSFPPERPPPYANSYSTDPTEIYIEWTDIPVKYSNGKILGYRIRYKIYTKKETYQVVEAQFGFNAFTIKNLKPYTLYLVEVYGYNANGDGPVQYSMCKTIEGVPSIPVPNFVVNDMQSTSWWSVSWRPIPTEYVNGVLLGYRLIYYLSYRSGVEISGEKTKIVLDFDIYTRYYKQRDLLNYAIYSVSVAGFTAAGSGPAPEYQAKTCKCPEFLFANLYIKKPFTSADANLNPSGFFLTLLQEMVVKSCGSCQGYSNSKLYFNQSKSGDETIKSSEFDLKNAISNDVDISFPIYGMNGREVAPDSEFSVLVMSPGIAIVVRNENTINQVINKMLLGVLNVWPVLLISYAIASIFGIVIWFTDQFSNPEQFSKGSSLRGPLSGFWFTFVTMTTIGYGDLSPRSVLSRTFAMVWFLTGLILNGIIIAFIVTNLTTLSSSKDYMLYNTKVAALNNSLELKLAIINNAEVSQVRYTDILSMLEDLQNKVVDIVYVDTLSLLGYQSVLDEKSLTIISLDNINTGYGFVMSGSSVVLTIDIDSFIGSKSNEISAFATSLRSEIPSLAVQDSSQIIADIFSETSPAFQSSLIYLSIMIILFIVCAFTFEFIMRRKKNKVGVDATFKQQLFELKQYVSDFRNEFAKVTDQMVCQHDEERVILADLKRFYKNKVKRIGVSETERLAAMNDKYRFNPVIFKQFK
ncbi:uncharacterized protein LOC105850908 isoform X2 [Hydra vulgaris]|uniref:uncharacterized protein LOC105850908 isoform X2 n=1 Tax=Hydra vulgaris TaxID=6087 RepID=UPI001F5EB25A|nr:uncharacterized protein LOC105850908 isoform X2 [Hydra vulgaris]